MKIIKKIKALLYQNVMLRIVIGIIFIALVAFIWTWSMQVCSTGHPNIRILDTLEDDFYG